MRASRPGRIGRLLGKFAKLVARIRKPASPYATWKGPVDDKIELLGRARFCIAHENCRDLPGYVTEKLFDCFRAGCAPVYVGPAEIADLVPPDCFIDGRRFADPGELHAYLRSVDDDRFLAYQNAARAFLGSARATPFSRENFVQKIVEGVIRDLGR